MAGTVEGGKKAAAKNLEKDPEFYKKIGRKGGQNGRTGGFAANKELARRAGRKGGRISRRGPYRIGPDISEEELYYDIQSAANLE